MWAFSSPINKRFIMRKRSKSATSMDERPLQTDRNDWRSFRATAVVDADKDTYRLYACPRRSLFPLLFLLLVLSAIYLARADDDHHHHHHRTPYDKQKKEETLIPQQETGRKRRRTHHSAARSAPEKRGATASRSTADTKPSTILESIWNRLLHSHSPHDGTKKDDGVDKKKDFGQELPEPSNDEESTSPRPRRLTRRRALYEYALKSHYANDHPPVIDRGDDVDDTALDNDATETSSSSWMDHDQSCVYYNEQRNSHWTYQWCPPDHSNKDGTLVQQHWKPRMTYTTSPHSGVEWRIANQHSLGSLLVEPGESERQHWRIVLGWMPAAHALPNTNDSYGVDYYTDGHWCNTPSGSKRGRQRRRALVVRNPPICQQQRHTDKLQILTVTEPEACHYVFYVCEERSEPVVDTEDEESSSVEHVSVDTITSINNDKEREERKTQVLRSYLHQSGVDMSHVDHSDRTTSLRIGLPPFPPSRSVANRELIRDMFQHAYDSYMYHAFPASELQPLTCTPGTFDLVRLPALTLIDTLDTLIVMGNATEFARSVERLRLLHGSMEGGLFGVPQNVSVFETNIRVLGGLLSAHQLAEAFLSQREVEKMEVFDKKGHIRIGSDTHERDVDNAPEHVSDDIDPATDAGLQIDVNTPCRVPSVTSSHTVLASCEQPRAGQVKNGCRTNSTRTTNSKVEYWTYDGYLLDLALDLGQRLLPAFDSKTGIPYGTVNLVNGIPRGETTIASLAGGGTLTLEMELLSHLTGDESFGNAAKLATRALWMRRSRSLLLGKHIDIERGEWTETLSGIGSNSDSFYEYLIKHYILFPDDDDFWSMFVSTYSGVYNGTRLGEWYVDADMNRGVQQGGGSRRVLESLMAFYPGMQVLLGELAPASRTLNSFFIVRELLGVLPERFNFGNWKVDGGAGGAAKHPLRPELLESCYFLHRAAVGLVGESPFADKHAESSGWLWAADYALHSLNRLTDTERCGYATVDDTDPSTSGALPGSKNASKGDIELANEMPSFFLSETLKYLYLSFDDDNILHSDDEHEWVFTTEAHPIHSTPLDSRDGTGDRTSLENLRKDMIDLLHSRLEKKASERSLPTTTSDTRISRLSMEKWTMSSQLPEYMVGISASEADVLMRKGSPSSGKVYHGTSVLMDVFDPSEVPHHTGYSLANDPLSNAAFLSIADRGVGEGSSLKKSCPNFHCSTLDWVRALNGGGLDYGDIYVSSVSDDSLADSVVGLPILFVEDALAFQGSGIYPGATASAVSSCPVSAVTDGSHTDSQNETQESATANWPTDTLERVDMGETIGQFDVSVFNDGGGFIVRHVDSGETILATLLDQEKGEESPSSEKALDATFNPFVMVFSTGPVSPGLAPERTQTDGPLLSAHTSGTSWRSISGRVQGGDALDDETDTSPPSARSLVFADTRHRAFRCQVQILEMSPLRESTDESCNSGLMNEEGECNSDESFGEELLLASVPCSPAMFGPSLLNHLEETGGMSVEGTVASPRADFGCSSPCDKSNGGAFTWDISIVWRGKCTFESKAVSQKARHGSQAVIIINDAEDELFLMSGGRSTKEVPCVAEESVEPPLTVLVTRKDGMEILSIIKDYQNLQEDGSGVNWIGRVQLFPCRGHISADGVLQSPDGPDKVDWPVVRSAPDTIQVLAEGGWGIQAVRSGALNRADRQGRDWQLFMLRHERKTETSEPH